MIKPNTYPFKESLYNPNLQCAIYNLYYDYVSKVGVLIMASLSCCNMTACIDIFKSIDPKVKQIQTYEGENKDTVYILHNDEWIVGL